VRQTDRQRQRETEKDKEKEKERVCMLERKRKWTKHNCTLKSRAADGPF
jgi:hypothetical protein